MELIGTKCSANEAVANGDYNYGQDVSGNHQEYAVYLSVLVLGPVFHTVANADLEHFKLHGIHSSDVEIWTNEDTGQEPNDHQKADGLTLA